jgi:calcium permeable stress-gated cation channel
MDIWRADHNDIRHQNGMDAFFFVQFLRMMARIFLPIWIISWAVLMPVTDAGKTNGLTGLDQFTFGNVSTDQQARYAAHIILVYGFTCEYTFVREYKRDIDLGGNSLDLL